MAQIFIKCKATQNGIRLIKNTWKNNKTLTKTSIISRANSNFIDTFNLANKDNKILENDCQINNYIFDKFIKGEPVNLDIARAFCKVLNLDIDMVVIQDKTSINNGLIGIPKKYFIFNSYQGHRCLDEIWVDPMPMLTGHDGVMNGYMQVHVVCDNDQKNSHSKHYVKVIFKRQGWGCNFTLRPEDDSPIIASSFDNFSFELRSPFDKSIGVRIRITDANDVIWCYGESSNKQDIVNEDFQKFNLEYIERGIYTHEDLFASSNKWKRITISLEREKWFHFGYDGKFPDSKNNRPDFNAIKLVTFDVGFEDSNKSDKYCQYSGFSKEDDREGEIHFTPIIFE